MLKARGGLAQGHGIITGTQSKVVHVLPQTVPVCESLETFCGIHSQTCDQHTDIRATTACDGKQFLTLQNYLSQHTPFAYRGEHSCRLAVG